jgi:hypothetical protein
VRCCRQKKSEEEQASDIPMDSEPDSDYDEDGGCTSKSAKKEKKNKKAKQPENAGKGGNGLAGAAVLLCRCSRADLGWSNCVLLD